MSRDMYFLLQQRVVGRVYLTSPLRSKQRNCIIWQLQFPKRPKETSYEIYQ